MEERDERVRGAEEQRKGTEIEEREEERGERRAESIHKDFTAKKVEICEDEKGRGVEGFERKARRNARWR